MDCWWAELELELKLSLKIQDQDKAELEEQTGCNLILLRPLLSASRIIPESQSTGSDKHYAAVMEHLLSTLENSGEVRKVRKDVLAFVADKFHKMTSEPAKWRS
jgi:hypothetical protein